MSARAFFVSASVAPTVWLSVTLFFGGCGREIAIGGDLDCDAVEACGEALGAPAVRCWDDSLAGNTGRCVRDVGGSCAWQLLECPAPPACDESECRALIRPTAVRSRCERDTSGVCRWMPTSPCTLADCSSTPPVDSWTCEDGSVGGFTGRCVAQGSACDWEYNDCTPANGECDVSECGPVESVADCLCGGCERARCVRTDAGICRWISGSAGGTTCLAPALCVNDSECEPGSYCAFPVADACGELDNAAGQCVAMTDAADCAVPSLITATPRLGACGCDGITYANRCEAARAGALVRFDGSCTGNRCVSAAAATDRCLLAPATSCAAGTVPRYDEFGCLTFDCVVPTSCECASHSDCPAEAPKCDVATSRCAE